MTYSVSRLLGTVLAALVVAAAPRAQGVSLPITFEGALNYELTDFGGAASTIVADPTNATNRVVRTVRTAAAECFAGTTVADATGFTTPIPFAAGATTMSVRVWSPVPGIRVLFKVEQVGVPTVNVETLATTTATGAWETLVFDFGNPMPNRNPIAFGSVYNKASIFFDFSCDLNPAPPAPPERTYYWDDVSFGGQVTMGQTIAGARALPLGTEVTLSGTVTRTEGAFTYFQDASAGMAIRQTSGAFFDAVASGAIAPGTRLTVTGTTSQFNGLFQISGAALTSYTVTGTGALPAAQEITLSALGEAYESELVRIKNLTTTATGTFAAATSYTVTDASGAGVLRVVGATDSEIDGTAIPTAAFTFEGVVGQFNGGTGDTGYQLLAIALGDVKANPVPVVSLPVTFEEAINYELTDFGGAASTLVPDPTDATNTVVQTVRTAAAECFAGTTVADVTGFTAPIPLAAGATTMSVRVWTPVAGTRVLLKVEQVGAPAIFVETLATTTTGGAWETLVFDFANPGPNGRPITAGDVYNKVSIFFDFSCGFDPVPTGRTYYWDDLTFGRVVGSEAPAPAALAALSVFPNPTTGVATVAFDLAAAGDVSLEVLDAVGRRVATLAGSAWAAGPARLAISTAGLAPGLYIVRLRTESGAATARFSVVR